MTKNELLNIFLTKNPEFKDPKYVFKMTAHGFLTSVEQAYDQGVLHGRETAPKPADPVTPFDSIFNSMKGKKP